MRKIFITLVLIVLSANICSASHPLDTNWRSYIYDKQAWELGPVHKILTKNNKLFASGMFGMRFYDSLHFNGIAQLKDSLWVPLGSGTSAGIRGFFPVVNDMTLKDSLLYVGGSFDSAGTQKAYNLAYYNTNSETWSGIGDSIFGGVLSLQLKDNDLFVAGSFDSLKIANDTVPFNYIAKWTGSSWDSLGAGLNGTVYNMTLKGNELFVVGEFDTAGTAKANNIAIWNDSTNTWSAYGDKGPIGEVTTLCKVENDMYFAGDFDKVYTGTDTIDCKNIVKWDGTSWDSLGSGITGDIMEMKADSNILYVVGSFTKTIDDTVNCYHIVKWVDNEWKPMGSGTDLYIYTVSVAGDSVLIGGTFNFTGDTLNQKIGLWYNTANSQNKRQDDYTIANTDIKLNIFPNPADHESIIEFYLEQSVFAEIKIYDLQGKHLLTLAEDQFSPGKNRVIWDNNEYPPGVYLCKIIINGSEVKTKKIIKE